MKEKKFLKKDAIRHGWKAVGNNLWFVISMFVVAWILGIVPKLLMQAFGEGDAIPIVAIGLASFSLDMIISAGIIKIVLELSNGRRGEYFNLISEYRLFFKFLGGRILYMIVVGFGLILFIFPGIIWALKFVFTDYFVVDKGMGPIEAMKESARITKGSKWDLLLLSLILAGINILGALFLGVGLLITVPISLIALASVYQKLLGRANAEEFIKESTPDKDPKIKYHTRAKKEAYPDIDKLAKPEKIE